MKLKIIFILLATLIFASPVFSQRRPTNIEIKPDFENNQLYIKVYNYVRRNKDKYVRKVDIEIDKRPIITESFYFQKVGYFKDFTIDVEDLIEVKNIIIKAYRDKGGALDKEFDVQALFKEEIAKIITAKEVAQEQFP